MFDWTSPFLFSMYRLDRTIRVDVQEAEKPRGGLYKAPVTDGPKADHHTRLPRRFLRVDFASGLELIRSEFSDFCPPRIAAGAL
jgi:hypothetical protein